MRKLMLLLCLLLSFVAGLTQISINAGPHAAFGSIEDGLAGAGGSVEGAIHVSAKGAARLYGGYTRIPPFAKSHIDFFALRLGYQHYLSKKLFVFGDVGAGSFYFPTYDFTRVSFGVGGGYKINFAKNFLQLSALYDYTKGNFDGYYAWYTLRVAYGFQLND